MGKEVRAHGLNVALSSSREGANSLEVLLCTPARRQGGEGNVDNLNRSHCKESVMGMVPKRVRESSWVFLPVFFFLPLLAARQSKDGGSRHASCNVLRPTASDLVVNAPELNLVISKVLQNVHFQHFRSQRLPANPPRYPGRI